jgi:hypothetical protein
MVYHVITNPGHALRRMTPPCFQALFRTGNENNLRNELVNVNNDLFDLRLGCSECKTPLDL